MKVTTDKEVFNGRDSVTHEPVALKKDKPTEVSDEYGRFITYEFAPNVRKYSKKK